MSTISKSYTFTNGSTILAEEHNTNFDTLYNWANGNITNSNIKSGAAISLSKLSLSDNATLSGAITFSGNVVIGTANQGDILYDDGTKLTRLTPGTDGQYLKSQGAEANPVWATVEGVPSGVIVMWSGTIATIPTGWFLCDGTNDTPNLRERFVIGAIADADSAYDVGDTGDGTIPEHRHSIGYTQGDPNAMPYLATGNGVNPETYTGYYGTGTKNIAVYFALAFIQKG